MIMCQKCQITKTLVKKFKEKIKQPFEKWLQRKKLCILNDGHYIDHLIKKVLTKPKNNLLYKNKEYIKLKIKLNVVKKVITNEKFKAP